MQIPMTNVEIAELLRNIAAAYEIKQGDKARFKIIAYNKAADAVEHLSSEAKDLFDNGKLEEVSGIGPSIARHLADIFSQGSSPHFDKLLEGLPPAIFEMMKVEGIGPKTAHKLANSFNIKSKSDALNKLKEVAQSGKIAKLEGFGEDSQTAILKSLEEVKVEGNKRMLLPYAQSRAEEIINWLKQDNTIKKADPLGSLRRKASTIGDVDIAVASNDAKAALERFVKFPQSQRVLDKGEKAASILLPGNVRADVKVVNTDSYGSLLQHFTGSKHHNIALREFALKKGLSLSEWGIKKSEGKLLQKYATEEEFYKALGLTWIPPELREDMGEIEASLKDKLPVLIELKDIRGDLQIHSSFDVETSHDLGASSMEEVIEKANRLGYEYIAFTEHNPSRSKHSNQEIIDILKRKKEKVEQINYSLVKGVKGSVRKVFNSLEIDILPDGKLPVPLTGLETLDFALVSIHSQFRQEREVVTRRVLQAFDNPKVKVFAHPSGRKLNEREGADLDWNRVFEKAKQKNIWLEVNSDPMRLDLPDALVKDAIDAGLKLTLGTDAHHAEGMENIVWGVDVARRGWATKEDIVNTRSLIEFEKMIS